MMTACAAAYRATVVLAVKIVQKQRYPNLIFDHDFLIEFIYYIFILKSILKYLENSKKLSLDISE